MGVRISNVRYEEDDTAFLANILEELQEIVECQPVGEKIRPRNKRKKDQIHDCKPRTTWKCRTVN